MNSKIKRVAEIIAEGNSAQENFKSTCRKHQKERKGIKMNKDNHLQEQLEALSEMSLDELRDLCRKYCPGIKHCRSKILLRKKISFMLPAEVLGNLAPSMQQQISELGLGQPRVKNNKGFITGTTFTRKWKDRTYRLVAVADGFVMDGQKFKSLSGAAMAVTGTQWSGKVFWKVK